MAEQSPYAAHQAEVAWLEKALFLAAQELAAFRASASAERERAASALREVEGRLRALEAERSDAERRHAVELDRARAKFDAELAERVKAWAELGQDVATRSDAAAAAYARWELEAERSAQLNRDLTDARQQIKEAFDVREALLARFTTLEEQFAAAAASARESTEQVTASRLQLDRINVELNQSIERCRQLEGESRTLAEKLNLRSEDCESAERSLGTTRSELIDAQSRIVTLERAATELQATRPELERERDMRKAANDKIDKLLAAVEEQKKKAAEAEADAAQQRASIETLNGELQLARREREESRRDLEVMQRSRAEQVAREQAEAKKVGSEREVQLQAELEELRTEQSTRERELSRELEAARRERDEARRDGASQKHELDARTQAELEAARKDRDEARRELNQFKRELEQRTGGELASLRKERDELRRELDENSGIHLAMLELERDRVAKLRVELDEAKADLERTRSERETMREELAHQQRMALGGTPVKSDPRTEAERRRVEREQQMTVPIPDRAPANEVATEQPVPPAPQQGAAPGRRGSYSVSQVEEEQVFVRKGGGGGRGTR